MISSLLNIKEKDHSEFIYKLFLYLYSCLVVKSFMVNRLVVKNLVVESLVVKKKSSKLASPSKPRLLCMRLAWTCLFSKFKWAEVVVHGTGLDLLI